MRVRLSPELTHLLYPTKAEEVLSAREEREVIFKEAALASEQAEAARKAAEAAKVRVYFVSALRLQSTTIMGRRFPCVV